MGNVKIKGPITFGIIVLVIILIENLMIGNGFVASFFRSIISGLFTFGLGFGLLFLLSKIENEIKEKTVVTNKQSENENSSKNLGTNVDYTVDDGIIETNIFDNTNKDDSKQSSSEKEKEEETPYNFEDFMNDGDSSSSSSNDDDVGSRNSTDFYSNPANSEKVKEILDSQVSEADMAKAIRTVLKRDQ